MKPFWLYILKCIDDSYYVGHTDDIERRIEEHKLGKINGYTSMRLPVTLVFIQQFSTRAEALVAEQKIKRWTRIKKELLVTKEWQGLKDRSHK